jgi:hypothetical protein
LFTSSDQPLRGGAGASRPEAEIMLRLRELMDGGRLPDRPPPLAVPARSRGESRPCVACGIAPVLGELEYDVRVAGTATSVLFHQRCLELWRLEAERRGELAALIRLKIDTGELPSRPTGMVAATSDGRPCTACGRPITPAEPRYELLGPPRGVGLHRRCLDVLLSLL